MRQAFGKTFLLMGAPPRGPSPPRAYSAAMHFRTALLVALAAGLLTACSPQPAAPAPDPTPATAASTPPATPAQTTAAAGVEPVNCGPIGPDGGAQVQLVADATEAGRVGCTEAINVLSAYYRDAPTSAEGTGRHLTVDGWACAADTGAYGSGTIGCAKDGFAFHTEP